jgi:hypothetical protein
MLRYYHVKILKRNLCDFSWWWDGVLHCYLSSFLTIEYSSLFLSSASLRYEFSACCLGYVWCGRRRYCTHLQLHTQQDVEHSCENLNINLTNFMSD